MDKTVVEAREMSISAVGPGGAMGLAVEGYRNTQRRMNAAAEKIASGSVDAMDPEPLVDLKLAEHLGQANVSVIRTADRMQESLLDILA